MSSPPASPQIALGSETLQDLDSALRREWLVTNRFGGYGSASIATANTRRYHGLLVAALKPPLGRAVLLSKLEETVEVVDNDGRLSPTYALSVNLYPGAVYPQGHRCLESFECYPSPTWTWSPKPGVRFQKTIWMAAGRNTTYIRYTLLDSPDLQSANLHIVPLFAWKDYHSEMKATGPLEYMWHPPLPRVAQQPGSPCGVLSVPLPAIARVTTDPVTIRLHILDADGGACPSVKFLPQQYWFYHFQHPREYERGQDATEDLLSLGMLSMTLKAGDSVTVVATVEDESPEPPKSSWERHTALQTKCLESLGESDEFEQKLALSADSFLVDAAGERSTLIAGYPWFCDWGRDTMISVPGLCLHTGLTDTAKEILLSFARFIDQGMLPNRFPDVGEVPEYNTVDASLWYFVAAYHTVRASSDHSFAERIWPILEEIVRWHKQGTRYNIHLDHDHLLFAGQQGVQLTWMDAKVGDWVVTPRIGKPVEINALWHNALKTMAQLARLLDKSAAVQEYEEQARLCAAMFAARFARHDGRGLADVLDTPNHNAPDESIRPNQIFAVSLPFAPLEAQSDLARAVVDTLQQELYTPLGMRTLSPHDPAYRPRYEGDAWSRDGAYHQGTAWPWLVGPFAEAHYKVYRDREAAMALLAPLSDAMETYGVGSIAEVYDGGEPQRPNGCIAQAWSVAETLRVWRDLRLRTS